MVKNIEPRRIASDEVQNRIQADLLERLISTVDPQGVLDAACALAEVHVGPASAALLTLDGGRVRCLSAPSIAATARTVIEEHCGSSHLVGHLFGQSLTVDLSSCDRDWESLLEALEASAWWSFPLAVDQEAILVLLRLQRGAPAPATLDIVDRLTRILGLATRRRGTAPSLSETQDLLTSVIEGAEDCIWIKDVSGRYVFVNRSEARGPGLRPDHFLQHTDLDIYSPDVARVNIETDQEVIRKRSPVTYLHTVSQNPGGWRTYHISKQPRLDTRGEVTGVLGIARDVTALETQRLLQIQMEGRDRLSLFANRMAHTFNNLLMCISGNAEWVRTQLKEHPSLLESLAEIVSSVEDMKDITQRLLTATGQAPETLETLDVVEFFRDAVQRTKRRLGVSDAISFAASDDLPHVMGDQRQLGILVEDLITNAWEALGGGPGTVSVTVSVEPPRGTFGGEERGASGERRVTLTVQDDGAGMLPETSQRAYDPFFTTKPHHVGLGLTTVMGIVQAHGGRILHTSDPGIGSTFTVHLPALEPPQHVPGAKALVAVLADDDDDVRRTVGRLLAAAGFHVLSAMDGWEALDILSSAKEPVDIAIIDQEMPGIDGVETCVRISASPRGAPVLLISGAESQDARRLGIHVLRKPFRLDELTRMIERVWEAAGRSQRVRGPSTSPPQP